MHTVSPQRHDSTTTATCNSTQVARCANTTDRGLQHENTHAIVPEVGMSHHHQDSMHTAPRHNATVGTGDGMQAQRCSAHRRCSERQEGSSSDVEPQEQPGTAKRGVQRGLGMHFYHHNSDTASTPEHAAQGGVHRLGECRRHMAYCVQDRLADEDQCKYSNLPITVT